MKPRNRYEANIVKLSKEIPKINEDQKAWMKTKMDKFVTYKWKSHVCLDCNHRWKDNIAHTEILKGTTCPSCGSKLEIANDFNGWTEQIKYFGIFDTHKKHQIVRVFHVSKRMYTKSAPNYYIREVTQHWISEDGETCNLGLKPGWASYYSSDNWSWGSTLMPRTNSQNFINKCRIIPHAIYPKKRTLKILRRNGFKTSTYDYTPNLVFSALLSNPKAETLFKAKQYELFYSEMMGQNHASRHWNSVKIALRNNYKVKDAKFWFDYLDNLVVFNKDMRNHKLVCPKDLHSEHDRYLKKKRELNAKIALEQQKAKMDEEQKVYKKKIKKYLKLEFKDEDLVIKPLETVKDFLIEGEVLNHCVYENRYYEDHSLLMSAKIKGEHMETIEVDLDNFQLTQSRGMNNLNSKYHKRIVNLVKKNINQIQKAS